MNPVVVVVAVVVVFGVLVSVHEAGHMVVAKVLGVKVLEFNVGFGRPLWQRQWGETVYGLRAIPLGGYVRLAGMDDDETGPRSFQEKAVWRRVLIIVAGPLTNLALPLLVYYLVLVGQAGAPVTVKSLTPGYPAAAQMQVGDELVSVDGVPVTSIEGFRSHIGASAGRTVVVRVQRNGKPQDLVLAPQPLGDRFVIGVVGKGSFDIARGAGDTVDEWRTEISAIFGGFYSLVSGRVPGGLAGRCGPSGPVGIVRATGEAASAGLLPLVLFAGFLSLNLGILNLMPIPALDGGRIVFLLVEAVRRRPVNPLREQRVHYAGFMVLLTLIVLVSFNDVLRLGQSFTDLVQSCG